MSILIHKENPLKAGLVPVISSECLSGASINGLVSFQIANYLKTTFPEARFLIVVREQLSYIPAYYQEYFGCLASSFH